MHTSSVQCRASPGARTPSLQTIRRHIARPWRAAWAAATEAERGRARARLAVVERFETLARSGMPAGHAKAACEAGVSANSLYNWRKLVRGVPKSCRGAALLDRPRSGRPSALDAELRRRLEALTEREGPRLTARRAREVLFDART